MFRNYLKTNIFLKILVCKIAFLKLSFLSLGFGDLFFQFRDKKKILINLVGSNSEGLVRDPIMIRVNMDGIT